MLENLAVSAIDPDGMSNHIDDELRLSQKSFFTISMKVYSTTRFFLLLVFVVSTLQADGDRYVCCWRFPVIQ